MSSIIDRNYDLLIRFTLICLPQNENELRVWDVVYSEDPEETAKPSWGEETLYLARFGLDPICVFLVGYFYGSLNASQSLFSFP